VEAKKSINTSSADFLVERVKGGQRLSAGWKDKFAGRGSRMQGKKIHNYTADGGRRCSVWLDGSTTRDKVWGWREGG